MTLGWFFYSKYYFTKKDDARVISCSLPDGSPPLLSPPSVMWCENRLSAATLRYPSLCYRPPGEPDCSQVSWSAGLLVCVRGGIIQTWLKRHTCAGLLSPQWAPGEPHLQSHALISAAASDGLQIQSWRCRSTCCSCFLHPICSL